MQVFDSPTFPSRFPLLPSCLFTRHLWLKEGGKTAFTKVCPSAALDPKTTSPPTATVPGPAPTRLSAALRPRLPERGVYCCFYYSLRLLVPIQPTSPSPSTPPTRRESGSGVDKRGCSNVHHNRPRTFPGLPSPNLTCSAHVPTATKHPLAPIPAGLTALLLQHLHSSSPPTNASHHRNCGSNTCRPLRTRRQATSTPNNNNNHTKTCPPVPQTPLRHPPRQITHLPPSATPWLRPHHPPP